MREFAALASAVNGWGPLCVHAGVGGWMRGRQALQEGTQLRELRLDLLIRRVSAGNRQVNQSDNQSDDQSVSPSVD